MKESPANAPLVTFLIPVLDEQETIGDVVEEIRASAEKHDLADYEVLVIDDGSTDDTCRVIESVRSTDRRIRCVSHGMNRGKSAALVTGALEARAPWLAMMDGDGQNGPDDLIAMWRHAEQMEGGSSPVIVAGSRRKRRDTVVKRISSRLANFVRQAVLKDQTPDSGCGMKVLRRDTMLGLPRFENMHRFLPALVVREGGRVLAMAVDDRPRAGGQSKYGFNNRFWTGLLDLAGVWWLVRRPLQVAPTPMQGPSDTDDQGGQLQ